MQSAEIRLGSVVKALVACLVIGAAGVIYVRQQHELSTLTETHRALRRQLDDLRAHNTLMTNQLADLETPERLEAEIRRREPELQLRLVQPGQVVVLTLAPGAGGGGAEREARSGLAGEVRR